MQDLDVIMDNIDEPELLLYARSHGIAADSSNAPIWSSQDLSLDPGEWDDKIDDQFKKMYNDFHEGLRNQKLDISRKSGRLACDAMREKTGTLEINWDNFLPKVPRLKTIILEGPIEDEEEEPVSSKKETGTVSQDVLVVTSPLDSAIPRPASSPKDEEACTISQDPILRDFIPRAGPLSGTLGSLSTFMASRRVKLKDLVLSSPQSPTSTSNDTGITQYASSSSSTICEKTLLQSIPGLNRYKPLPYTQKSTEDIIIFLSPKLLASHVKIIQHFEKRKLPPRIIYRDTTSWSEHVPELTTTPEEADIVISPTTGVVLTTIQSLTQLYLPGHMPTNPLLRSHKINSPILEKIFRLASRYEQLYILCTHFSGMERTSTSQNTAVKVDKPLQESIRSLHMLCYSLSNQTTITPLTISSDQSIMAECIFSLACKHAPNLTATHIQGEPRIKLQQLIKEHDTSFENYLRQSGLNPFAARVVLDLMELKQRTEAYLDIHRYRGKAVSKVDQNEAMSNAFAAFVDMTHADRMGMFREWIGERVLVRLGQVLKKSGKARSRD